MLDVTGERDVYYASFARYKYTWSMPWWRIDWLVYHKIYRIALCQYRLNLCNFLIFVTEIPSIQWKQRIYDLNTNICECTIAQWREGRARLTCLHYNLSRYATFLAFPHRRRIVFYWQSQLFCLKIRSWHCSIATQWCSTARDHAQKQRSEQQQQQQPIKKTKERDQ